MFVDWGGGALGWEATFRGWALFIEGEHRWGKASSAGEKKSISGNNSILKKKREAVCNDDVARNAQLRLSRGASDKRAEARHRKNYRQDF